MFQTHSKLRSTENCVINSHSKQKLCCFCCSSIRTGHQLWPKCHFVVNDFMFLCFPAREYICICKYIYLRTECKPKHAPIDGLFVFYWPSKVQNNKRGEVWKVALTKRYGSFSSLSFLNLCYLVVIRLTNYLNYTISLYFARLGQIFYNYNLFLTYFLKDFYWRKIRKLLY